MKFDNLRDYGCASLGGSPVAGPDARFRQACLVTGAVSSVPSLVICDTVR